jgi:hypothetical protein
VFLTYRTAMTMDKGGWGTTAQGAESAERVELPFLHGFNLGILYITRHDSYGRG